MQTNTDQHPMHLKEKAFLVYTVASSLVGTSWMGYQAGSHMGQLLAPIPPRPAFCLECNQNIMVGGCHKAHQQTYTEQPCNPSQ